MEPREVRAGPARVALAGGEEAPGAGGVFQPERATPAGGARAEVLADYYENPPPEIANWPVEFLFAADHADFSVPVLRHPTRKDIIAIWNEDEGKLLVLEMMSEEDAEEALKILSKLAEATGHEFVPSVKWLTEVLYALTWIKESEVRDIGD